jgi:hypothetical protein
MAASEMLERFSKDVMREAFKASAGAFGEVGVWVGDAFISFSFSPDCL